MTLDQILDIAIVFVVALIVLAIAGYLLWNPFLSWCERYFARKIAARGVLRPEDAEHIATRPEIEALAERLITYGIEPGDKYVPGARCPVHLGNLAGEQCRLAAGHPDAHNFTWERPAALPPVITWRNNEWVEEPPDRWQYGVRWTDNSESWPWNGRSSRHHAEACIHAWPEGRLIRRPVDRYNRPVDPSYVEEVNLNDPCD